MIERYKGQYSLVKGNGGHALKLAVEEKRIDYAQVVKKDVDFSTFCFADQNFGFLTPVTQTSSNRQLIFGAREPVSS